MEKEPAQGNRMNSEVRSEFSVQQTTQTEVELRQLCVRAGERTLLQNASTVFRAGELTLILGCSGVGKSVLLRILAGLTDDSHSAIRVTGEVLFRKQSIETPAEPSESSAIAARDVVAVVFQNFALFDELSPLQNILIALDHSNEHPRRVDRLSAARSLLRQLQVPDDRAVSVLSGGQQQRLAIARAVAPGNQVVLYDEPTSGLDIGTARGVASLIRQTHEAYRRTSIVVTHDYATLTAIADRILILDHQRQTLDEVPREFWDQLSERLGAPPDMAYTAPATRRMSSLVGWIGGILDGAGQFALDVLQLPLTLLPVWRSIGWGLRYSGYYLWLVSGPSACLYVAVACMILGYVAQDFVFRYLPFRQFSEPLLTENLLHATGFSLFRFLVPILSTLLIAARSGAAVAADVGSKVYGHQLDALRCLGAAPDRVLRTPILYAFVLGTPLLCLLGYFTAACSAAFAFLLTHPEPGLAFWDAHFHKELISEGRFFYRGAGWLTCKLLLCGAGIAVVAWRQGRKPKLSSADISRGVTRTILWSTLLVLGVHFLFSLYEFQAKK
ncbi:MAG: Arginine transport ATP-binding protein ArtP [Planctomycetota bacterium]|jgi:ABC-type polar amino acid transport system ATPase subunit/ABC-type transporter Mla maintaining outer membrane lipid asymmetry permease subunit MlaE